MAKFKVGDKVRVIYTIVKEDSKFMDGPQEIKEVTKGYFGDSYILAGSSNGLYMTEGQLELVETKFQVGQLVKWWCGVYRVLFVHQSEFSGEVKYVIEDVSDGGTVFVREENLNEHKEPEIVEMTVAEVSKALGKTIKIVE